MLLVRDIVTARLITSRLRLLPSNLLEHFFFPSAILVHPHALSLLKCKQLYVDSQSYPPTTPEAQPQPLTTSTTSIIPDVSQTRPRSGLHHPRAWKLAHRPTDRCSSRGRPPVDRWLLRLLPPWPRRCHAAGPPSGLSAARGTALGRGDRREQRPYCHESS